MRKRNSRVQVRLDKNEHQHFMKLVKKSGLSQEVYLRHLINGLIPNDAPQPDCFSMMKELYAIGNSLNQVAVKAHVLNVVDIQRYDMAVKSFNSAVKTITDAVVLPRKCLRTPQNQRFCGERNSPETMSLLPIGKSDK